MQINSSVESPALRYLCDVFTSTTRISPVAASKQELPAVNSALPEAHYPSFRVWVEV
jgi:hypothetical protein